MSSAFAAALAQLPRFSLATLPTPLQRADNLSAQLGVNLLIKRDDLTGLAMGGNKARKLEYIVADAQMAGADMLLTSAAAQSNFCRMTVGAARKAGMRAGLLLRGSGTEPVQGNLLLDHLLGAQIRFTQDMDPYSAMTHQALLDWAAEEKRVGAEPYLVYIHGASRAGALATIGYVDGAAELVAQLAANGTVPDHIYVAVGSGGTLAGLLLGLRHLALRTRVVGVCVGELSAIVRPKTLEFVETAQRLLDLPPVDLGNWHLEDSQRGQGYGVPTASGLDAISLLAQTEAVVANPVYTGKTLAALLADVEHGVIRPGETVVYMHTGGDPLVYAYADILAQHAAA
ncbi:MAG TPA: pyridoxal-phosphate dependent enzyme [Chloroflexota bacterium]|jgi:1-aminocyclopropane-1-carboxylate deaminase/D-cysteine desulfhydrase-like pyridoxal-dependent ACC family enzyme|nr:pyridoxal-phosphate dependent enzyme [Chloroflexota bacterium]